MYNFLLLLKFDSLSAYVKITNSFLILPNICDLHLNHNVSCEKGFLDISILKKKEVNVFREKDLHVNLLINEIRAKPKFIVFEEQYNFPPSRLRSNIKTSLV